MVTWRSLSAHPHQPHQRPSAAFIELIRLACDRLPLRVLAYCLMPNHFHLVLWPRGDGDLGRWMQWLLTSHVRRYHRHYDSSGHVWQGRFKAFPIERDEHLLTVMRYVERNALRGRLAERAEDWAWSSVRFWRDRRRRPVFLYDGPVDRGRRWVADVNRPMTDDELNALRQSINRGTPCGNSAWRKRIATRLGLESSLRPRGRPRKKAKK